MRNPAANPAPADVPDERLRVYRELLYKNIENLIASNFPVLKKITAADVWYAMVRDYYARHIARTPLFPKIPQEFLRYLESERQAEDDPPFILELAHYEWVEAALAIDTRDIVFEGVDPGGDLLEGIPVLSPLAWPLRYCYPVHRIRPDYLPTEAPEQPTYLVVFRDRQDAVGFMELNPVSARLIELVAEPDKRSGGELLLQIADELNYEDPELVLNGGRQIMVQLRDRDVILGTAI